MTIVKSIFFSCLVCSLISAAAGCGSKANNAAGAPRQASDQALSAPVEIKVAFWGAPDELNIIADTINEWQKERPDILIRLEHTPYRGYADKLLTRIAGLSAPDIICTEVDLFVTFQSKGVLLDLTPYVRGESGLNLKEFYPEIIDRFTVDGRLYAIPRDTAPFACVYYNKKLFDEAALAYPTDEWDVFELLDKAKKLTKTGKDGRIIQYGFYAWAWQNFVYAFGGSLVDSVKNPARCTLDSKESLGGLQFYSDLINKYRVHPTSTAMTSLAMGVQGMFMTDRLAMFSSGIWETPGLRKINDFDWDVVMFPKGPQGARAFGTGGSGYCILKNTRHPKESFEVIKAFTGRTAQARLADTGLAQPAIKDIAESEHWALNDKPPRNKSMLNETMRYVVYEPFHPAWREAKELHINPELDLVFSGRKSVRDAVDSFIGHVNDLLKK
jgi:multiple sugar transport system substrate-binding protein